MCRKTLISLALCVGLASAHADEPLTTDTPPAPNAPTTSAPPSNDVPPPPDPSTPSGTSLPVEAPALPPMRPLDPPRPSQPVVLAPIVPVAPRAEILYKRPRRGLIIAGSALFAAGWVADIAFTYGYDHTPGGTSIIPLAGPFLQMKQKYGLDGPPIDTGSSSADARAQKTLDQANTTIRDLAVAGEAICGAMQIAGVVLAIVGATTKRKITRYAATSNGLAVRF